MSALPETLLQSLRNARHIVVLTGAGVSAESGIPTFRDPLNGLWQQFSPAELATPEAFGRDPALVWGWYEWRRLQVQRAAPNAAHFAIAQLAAHAPELTLVTQNVDNLHERAGSRHVTHLHGELAHPYCEDCRERFPLLAQARSRGPDERRLEPPRCLDCGGRVRPGVVWFGESLPQIPWQRAANAAADCDVFLCIGTSAVVQPAASLIGIAHSAGAVTVQLNPNPTGVEDQITHVLQAEAAKALPKLLQAAWLVPNRAR